MSASAAQALGETGKAGRLKALSPVLLAWLMALVVMALSFVPMTAWTIQNGVLFDNDDAMRLVQVREWMDGKSWYDLNETRVDPPHGMVSHWPRLIELPIAGGIAIAEKFADRDLAERIVVGVWPSVMLAAFVLGLLLVASRLFAPPTLFAAAAIVAFSPLLQFQLAPGRIDHHGVQMLLALALAAATIGAVVGGRRSAAVAAGVVGALIVAIGLETLPIVAGAAVLFGAAWIFQGESSRGVVRAFGASFALATPLLFAATIAPSRWTVTACDALSPPWLLLASGGGLALLGLAAIRPPGQILIRARMACAAGGAVVAVFAALWPHCLAGPLADTDPLVRELWLSDVGEARSPFLLAADNPEQFLFFLVFPLIGTLALAVATFRERRRAPQFLILLAFAVSALVIAVPAMRGVPFASIFALFGWLYLFDRAFRTPGDAAGSIGLARAGIALAILVAALPFLWNALGQAAEKSNDDTADRASCIMRENMASLAAEPRGLVLAPLRLGPRILVATPHDIVGAPYHRNNDGNVAAFKMLLADAGDAHQAIKERGVGYVALCLGDTDLPQLTAYRKDSLLNDLVAGKAPSWLQPLPAHAAIRAWRVVD